MHRVISTLPPRTALFVSIAVSLVASIGASGTARAHGGTRSATTAASKRPTSVAAAPTKETIDATLAAVRAVHGAAGAWAVAGHRMGTEALQHFGLGAGSWDLEVVHYTPFEVRYACIADGIQAATGVSAGKLNLKLQQKPVKELRTVFRKKSTGEEWTVTLAPSLQREIYDLPRDKQEAVARTILTRPFDQVFVVTKSGTTK